MREDTKSTEHAFEPWKKPWLPGGVETVAYCPICGETDRRILHADLIDNAFRVAPGKWNLWQCAKCRSAYLDPRPTTETIYLAYASYYTHEQVNGKGEYGSLSPLRKMRRLLVNGYTNWRYGTLAMPSSAFGVPIACAVPGLKGALDRQHRHLPRLPRAGGKLLDVGCGDGSFLTLAHTCGWDVVGLDPDSDALAVAARQGLTVYQGGIEYFAGEKELFDAITLNHVLEHVHEPCKVLASCHDLLRPGGQIWLETPNIDSFGHARFQEDWRGLEAPRHLVIFNRQSLFQALLDAGFIAPQDRTRPSACAGMFQASYAMKHGGRLDEPHTTPVAIKLQAATAALAELFLPSRREFFTVSACKAVN